MFMAIINDTYSEVKTEVEARKEDFQMGDFVMRGYNNVRGEAAEWLCEHYGTWAKRTIKLKYLSIIFSFEEILLFRHVWRA